MTNFRENIVPCESGMAGTLCNGCDPTVCPEGEFVGRTMYDYDRRTGCTGYEGIMYTMAYRELLLQRGQPIPENNGILQEMLEQEPIEVQSGVWDRGYDIIRRLEDGTSQCPPGRSFR